jgi:ribosomal protein S2/predicted RNA-binding protein with TRAM domain
MVNTKQKTKNNSNLKKNKVRGQKTYKLSNTLVKVPQAIKVGSIYTVKITALSSANLGLNEFTYGFPILIGGLQQANATLGDLVQIQVLKIKKGLTTQKSAIAKVLKVVTKAKANLQEVNKAAFDTLGKTVDVTILKQGPKGTYLSELPGNFKLIVATQAQSLSLGQKVTVKVLRIKQNYAFATLTGQKVSSVGAGTEISGGLKYAPATDLQGSKLSLVLPKKAKRYFKHIVISFVSTVGANNKADLNNAPYQLSGSNKLFNLFSGSSGNSVPTILFIKPFSGAKLGDKVQIKILKAFKSNTAKSPNILIGKIVEINPISAKNQKAIIQTSIKQMLNSGMHFGEKAVKCNARMKNYVLSARSAGKKGYLANVSSSDQKNKPLIQKGRNIINLLKTRRCLNKALAQLTKYAAKGKTFLFVGTKKAASGLIARASLFSKKAFFVNTRWLGGMLTNWKTILKSISKVRPILKEKQVIIKDILQKRQSIKTLLMEKAFLLKKKSQVVLKKGRQLFQKLQALSNNSGNNISAFSLEGQNQKAQQLILKRKEFVQKGQILLEKRQLLLQKRKQLISQSTALYQKAIVLITNSKEFLTKATLLRQKLRELKALLFVSQQLQALQQTAKANNNALYTISYNQYKQLNNNLAYIIPNPPKDILNKMILLLKKNSLETSNISQKDATSSKVVILTKLLSQFSTFAPSIKLSIKVLLTNLQKIQTKLVAFQDTLKLIVAKMQQFINIKANIVAQLLQIQQSLTSQRNIIRIVKRKFKQILAQKRFIQFLPKLRYLPTPSTKISQTVQVLMKKIVDPKLKYPIDSIYDQKLISQSKKVAAMRKKKWQRLEKYLGGISSMTHMNTQQIRSNVAIIIGQQEEMNAVRECKKLGIKMFHIVDTNCNPGLADHFIPANDDSRNSIQLILTQFLTRIRLAQKLRKTVAKVKKSK